MNKTLLSDMLREQLGLSMEQAAPGTPEYSEEALGNAVGAFVATLGASALCAFAALSLAGVAPAVAVGMGVAGLLGLVQKYGDKYMQAKIKEAADDLADIRNHEITAARLAGIEIESEYDLKLTGKEVLKAFAMGAVLPGLYQGYNRHLIDKQEEKLKGLLKQYGKELKATKVKLAVSKESFELSDEEVASFEAEMDAAPAEPAPATEPAADAAPVADAPAANATAQAASSDEVDAAVANAIAEVEGSVAGVASGNDHVNSPAQTPDQLAAVAQAAAEKAAEAAAEAAQAAAAASAAAQGSAGAGGDAGEATAAEPAATDAPADAAPAADTAEVDASATDATQVDAEPAPAAEPAAEPEAAPADAAPIDTSTPAANDDAAADAPADAAPAATDEPAAAEPAAPVAEAAPTASDAPAADAEPAAAEPVADAAPAADTSAADDAVPAAAEAEDAPADETVFDTLNDDELAEGESSLKLLENAHSGLESILVSMENSMRQGGLSPVSAEFANLALEARLEKIGLSADVGSFPSFESYGAASSREQVTMESMEQVKAVMAKIMEAAKKLLKHIRDLVQKAIVKFRAATTYLKKEANELIEFAGAFTGLVKPVKLTALQYTRLNINGKVDPKADLQKIKAVADTFKNIGAQNTELDKAQAAAVAKLHAAPDDAAFAAAVKELREALTRSAAQGTNAIFKRRMTLPGQGEVVATEVLPGNYIFFAPIPKENAELNDVDAVLAILQGIRIDLHIEHQDPNENYRVDRISKEDVAQIGKTVLELADIQSATAETAAMMTDMAKLMDTMGLLADHLNEDNQKAFAKILQACSSCGARNMMGLNRMVSWLALRNKDYLKFAREVIDGPAANDDKPAADAAPVAA